LQIIRQNNYEPNLLARSLATKKKYLFASLLPFHTDDNAYWSGPLEGIKKAAEEVIGFSVKVNHFFFDQYDELTFRKATRELLSSTPDAVLMAPVFLKESQLFVRECDSKNIPYVFIDSNIRGQKNISYFGQDSYQSGYLAARLMSLGASSDSQFLIVHISRDGKNINHLKQRENGFRTWFKDHEQTNKTSIETIFLPGSEKDSADRILPSVINHETNGIFITSNAYKVGRYLKQMKMDHLRVIGYDLTEDNLKLLKTGMIDFLICQKPSEQGYRGIIALFNYLVNKKTVKTLNHIPIDIITRENYTYYQEFE